MPDKRRKFDREFREGAVRIARETWCVADSPLGLIVRSSVKVEHHHVGATTPTEDVGHPPVRLGTVCPSSLPCTLTTRTGWSSREREITSAVGAGVS